MMAVRICLRINNQRSYHTFSTYLRPHGSSTVHLNNTCVYKQFMRQLTYAYKDRVPTCTLAQQKHFLIKNSTYTRNESVFWLIKCAPICGGSSHMRWYSKKPIIRTDVSDKNNYDEDMEHQRNISFRLYSVSIGIFMLGMCFAGVPLYRIFCQKTGLGGKPTQGHDTDRIESMEPVEDRVITIKFNADTNSLMKWKFKPQQDELRVKLGETVLAFYSAENPTDEPIIGISTYNVVPVAAGAHFNKIQCFCFEEQMLKPHEKVDLPVFFYIDPEYDNDIALDRIDNILLSYTFFKAKRGIKLPYPGYS